MNELKSKDLNVATDTSQAMAETYVKPTIEVIEMEIEGAILSNSGTQDVSAANYGNAGRWGDRE